MKGRFFDMTGNQPVKVGLRSKITNELVAVYPYSINGSPKEVEKRYLTGIMLRGVPMRMNFPTFSWIL